MRFDSVPWWRCLTLPERLALLDAPHNMDASRARERLSRWHDLAVFRQRGLTPNQALAPLGISEDGLAELLGETDESLRERAGTHHPGWLDRAERWHTAWRLGLTGLEPDRELYNLVVPFVEGAVVELLERVRSATTRPLLLAEPFVQSLVDSVPSSSLSAIITPCLVQDMYNQRHDQDSVLHDVADEDVYGTYTALLAQDDARERVFTEYPLALRATVERLEMWVERRLEFVERLDRDFDRVCEELLDDRRPSDLTASFDVGDSHRRGQTVAILSSDVGRFVYKPRDARMETLFDILRDVVSSGGRIPPLRAAAFVAGDGYFWQEFVTGAEVTAADAPRTAEGLGALTAFLHCLRSNDFHHENVVLSAIGPVPIDLESVLHTSQDYRVANGALASNVGASVLDDSCLGVGILPHPLLVPGMDQSAGAADISVIGYKPGTAGGVRMPHLVNMGTGDMRIEYERAAFDSDGDIPGRALLHEQLEPFLSGYRAAYAAVLATAERVTDAVGHAESVSSRYIARPTMIYGKILAESYHPDFMRDALDRHLVLGKLLAHFVARPYRERLIAAETADLVAGDIPLFSLELTTGLLRASDDTTVVGRLEPPADCIGRHLGVLGAEHLAVQEHVIRLAFGCLPDSNPHGDPALPMRPSGGTLADDKLEAAAGLLERLEGVVIEDGRLGTLTLSAVAPQQWSAVPGGIDLYSGSTGIGLAALAVGEMTGSARALRIGEAALATAPYLASLVSNDDEAVRKNVRDLSTGAYGQVSGVALLTAAAHRAAPDPTLAEACRATVRMLGQMGPEDRFHDVISGNAGGILAAASVRDVAGYEETARTMRILADHLLVTAVRDETGLSWPQADDGTSLLGYSHGSCGIAYALSVAASVLGDDYLGEVAADAIAWESPRVTSAGDWPDLRPESVTADRGMMRAWCHGSPGAGYGRALLAARQSERVAARLSAELETALAATQETLDARIEGTGDVGNDSLCHGTVGNLLCMEAMVEVLTDHDEAVRRTAPYWEYLLTAAGPWRSGARDGVALPDLMMGLSGMAWGLAFSARSAPRLDLMSLEVR